MVSRQTRWFGGVAVHGFWADPAEPTVLFIHGAGGDHRFWTAQTRALAAPGRTTVAIDLPAHGRSGGSAAGGIETRRRAVEAFLDHVLREGDPGEGLTLVGHSMGSVVALDVAEHWPVGALALLGCGAEMVVNRSVLDAIRGGDAAMFDRWVGWMFAEGEASDRIRQAKEALTENGLEVLGEDLFAVSAWGGIQDDLDVARTLVVSGSRDRMTPPDDGRALAEILGAEYRLIDDGHMFPQTSHEETTRLLGEFLARP